MPSITVSSKIEVLAALKEAGITPTEAFKRGAQVMLQEKESPDQPPAE